MTRHVHTQRPLLTSLSPRYLCEVHRHADARATRQIRQPSSIDNGCAPARDHPSLVTPAPAPIPSFSRKHAVRTCFCVQEQFHYSYAYIEIAVVAKQTTLINEILLQLPVLHLYMPTVTVQLHRPD